MNNGRVVTVVPKIICCSFVQQRLFRTFSVLLKNEQRGKSKCKRSKKKGRQINQ